MPAKAKPRPNWLYHGDNLDILRRYIDDNSVDLVYLDPPFQSGKDYNLLFVREDGSRPAAQIKAFTDTWRWDQAAKAAFDEAVTLGGKPALVLEAFDRVVPETPMLAYLAMMALRLVELHRVLKPTGSLYLHCDPTASHYLKMLLDAVFGAERFASENIWKRTTAHSSAKKWAPVHDVILYYTKAGRPTWNSPRAPYDEAYLDKYYRFDDGDGRLYWRADITAAGVRKGETGEVWRGFDVTAKGRHWAYPPSVLDQMDKEGRVYWAKGGTGWPQEKRYREDLKGKAVSDLWDDIDRINPVGSERLGYPTQKPLALMERIIAASSNEGDVVLDPFCGCGTTIHAAHKLNRRWIGIDVAAQAIDIIEKRLSAPEHFGEIIKQTYELVREPEDLDSARALALQDRHQFEKWAVRLVGGDSDGKGKGADGGIDGLLQFQEAPGAPIRKIIISVKSNAKANIDHFRNLHSVVVTQKAAIGVLIELGEPTRQMRKEAASVGFYNTTHANQPEKFPKLQILTIAQLLNGETIRAPITFKRKGAKRKNPQTEFSFTATKAG